MCSLSLSLDDLLALSAYNENGCYDCLRGLTRLEIFQATEPGMLEFRELLYTIDCLPSLVSLSIDTTELGWRGCRVLGRLPTCCPRLSHLSINGSFPALFAIANLSEFAELKTLALPDRGATTAFTLAAKILEAVPAVGMNVFYKKNTLLSSLFVERSVEATMHQLTDWGLIAPIQPSIIAQTLECVDAGKCLEVLSCMASAELQFLPKLEEVSERLSNAFWYRALGDFPRKELLKIINMTQIPRAPPFDCFSALLGRSHLDASIIALLDLLASTGKSELTLSHKGRNLLYSVKSQEALKWLLSVLTSRQRRELLRQPLVDRPFCTPVMHFLVKHPSIYDCLMSVVNGDTYRRLAFQNPTAMVRSLSSLKSQRDFERYKAIIDALGLDNVSPQMRGILFWHRVVRLIRKGDRQIDQDKWMCVLGVCNGFDSIDLYGTPPHRIRNLSSFLEIVGHPRESSTFADRLSSILKQIKGPLLSQLAAGSRNQESCRHLSKFPKQFADFLLSHSRPIGDELDFLISHIFTPIVRIISSRGVCLSHQLLLNLPKFDSDARGAVALRLFDICMERDTANTPIYRRNVEEITEATFAHLAKPARKFHCGIFLSALKLLKGSQMTDMLEALFQQDLAGKIPDVGPVVQLLVQRGAVLKNFPREFWERACKFTNTEAVNLYFDAQT
jgi:hypothetical protein